MRRETPCSFHAAVSKSKPYWQIGCAMMLKACTCSRFSFVSSPCHSM